MWKELARYRYFFGTKSLRNRITNVLGGRRVIVAKIVRFFFFVTTSYEAKHSDNPRARYFDIFWRRAKKKNDRPNCWVFCTDRCIITGPHYGPRRFRTNSARKQGTVRDLFKSYRHGQTRTPANNGNDTFTSSVFVVDTTRSRSSRKGFASPSRGEEGDRVRNSPREITRIRASRHRRVSETCVQHSTRVDKYR